MSSTSLVEKAVLLALVVLAAWEAYEIRLYAINNFGRVIHEFDPWFNMRAAQYMADHGLTAFFTWYDYESWYPLGRPVGTTIYPGMQMTSVAIWNVLKLDFWKDTLGLDLEMSLNDVCVFVPAWFGAIATVLTGLLAYEVSGSLRGATIATLIMAIIPAHLMRSIGGGYDNESVAMTAMVLSFWLWCRSVRTPSSWPYGILAGLATGYMAAAWGGYVFVINMIAIHAGILAVQGLYNSWHSGTPYCSSLHKTYSIWYLITVVIAVQIPVINQSIFRSLEQISTGLVFLGLQFIFVLEHVGASKKFAWKTHQAELFDLYKKAILLVGGVIFAISAVLAQQGYFGPISVRVKSLFVKHTRTGNPLVDSVAEHQPTSPEAYWHYLLHTFRYVPVGLAVVSFKTPALFTRGKYFIILYFALTYYFSAKMNRLVILLGPVVSILAGVAIAFLIEWSIVELYNALTHQDDYAPAKVDEKAADSPATEDKKEEKASPKKEGKAAKGSEGYFAPNTPFGKLFSQVETVYRTPFGRSARVIIAALLLVTFARSSVEFYYTCDRHAEQISQPSIMFRAQLNNGQTVMINDYQEAYWWLRDNTPQDSRILSWWDYGYQINGIANRTTLADGNTWNLEHIALIGRILTAPEKKAHKLARHLADYVLIWAGNQGDDLAKSPHMGRIASSVYDDVCEKNDPLCYNFRYHPDHGPTPSMAASVLYKMHSAGRKPGVSVDPTLFKEVYSSKYGLVRIYQILNVSLKSKAWLADPANRVCDRPGSWYCVGQYPPSIQKPPSSHRHISYEHGD